MIIFINFIRNFFSDIFSRGKAIHLDEILDVYNQLILSGNNAAYAIFKPRRARKNETEILRLQFSIRKGQIGLDWVLLNPINIAQQEVFLAAAKSLAYQVIRLEDNGIESLRIEGDKSPLICRQLLANLYGIYGKQTIKLYVTGFIWKRKKR